jgi:hypothetical protein
VVIQTIHGTISHWSHELFDILRFQVLTVLRMKVTDSLLIYSTVWSQSRPMFLSGILMMEAVCTSQTSINFNETVWCYIPEGCHLHVSYKIQRKMKTLPVLPFINELYVSYELFIYHWHGHPLFLFVEDSLFRVEYRLHGHLLQ